MFAFSLPPDTRTARDGRERQRDRSAQTPAPRLCTPSMDFTKLNQHTRLCRWIVYSRATTSAMALRPVLPAGFLVWALDISIVSRLAIVRAGRAECKSNVCGSPKSAIVRNGGYRAGRRTGRIPVCGLVDGEVDVRREVQSSSRAQNPVGAIRLGC